MRTIDADKLLMDIEKYHVSDGKFQHWVQIQQTIEPERKKGKWIDAMVGEMHVQVCDQCNTFFPLAYTGGGHHFCPNCGADMRGDDHDL